SERPLDLGRRGQDRRAGGQVLGDTGHGLRELGRDRGRGARGRAKWEPTVQNEEEQNADDRRRERRPVGARHGAPGFIGTSTPRWRAAAIASGYPASEWRMTAVPGSPVWTLSRRRA